LAVSSDFQDSWSIQAAYPELDPLDQFLRVVSSTPGWIDFLMNQRNRIAGLFGLKDLGALSEIDSSKSSSSYMIGDRVGIFTLIEQHQQEVLLGDDDRHLNVVVSVHKAVDAIGHTFVTVSTMVYIKNWVGRLYMLPVAPAHHIIIQKMTKIAGNKAEHS